MEQGLGGKRVLVTGASSGIGQAVAEAMAAQGAVVAVHARTEARAKDTIDRIAKAGGKAFPVAADLERTDELRAMCEAAIAKLGGIDVVVNNAGVADLSAVTDMDERFWDWTMNVNLKAPFLVCKHTLPTMIAQGKGGVVLFTSSTNGKTADAEWSAYNTSKHGIIGFMRCLAAEVGKHGIRANAVCPGWAVTKMATDLHHKMADAAGQPYEDFFDASMRANMMRALIPAMDNAETYAFLASDRARFITGQAINVCGGLCYW
ncbi:MAG: SDR family oxidoreductase [Alphaproteobacteria bacterium]|nr:SDR family oxidoreductase [Alphaproteobacteria bacterium]